MISETGPSILLALQQATHRSLHALSAEIAELDLTASEINALANLADGRPRSVRELSHDTGTRTSTLTGVLDRLERRGYVTRELDAADRRSFRITLTERGRVAAGHVRDAIGNLERDALAGLSASDLAGFRAVIAALHGRS